MEKPGSASQPRILAAALKLFADRGYAGTSIQDIVDAARVTKPTLYYYFQSKAGLFQALIDWAHEERFRIIEEAAGRGVTLEEQLVEILAALFAFIQKHRDLMRIAFATAFAARGELPPEIKYLEKATRNLDLFESLIKQALTAGALDLRFDSREVAFGIYGMMTIKVMNCLVRPREKLSREDAVKVVQLFLHGAARRPS